MSDEPIYEQRGGYQWGWPAWWFAIIGGGATWPFCKMKIYEEYLEIRILFFRRVYSRAIVAVRRWTLIPILIDGIALDTLSSGSKWFNTFKAAKLLEELKKAGYKEVYD